MTAELAAGLERWDDDKIRCVECKRWCYEREAGIRHSSRCDSKPQPQAAKPQPTPDRDRDLRRAGRDGSIALVADEDEILDAVQRGALSVSDAMNRDY